MRHTVLILAVGGLMFPGCTGGDSESPAVTATAQASPQAEPQTPPPSPGGRPQGWTPELEERAAEIYANGIKRKYPLETRLAAGRCTIAKLKKFYDTFDDWLADHKNPESLDVLTRELGTLGTCEMKVGI